MVRSRAVTAGWIAVLSATLAMAAGHSVEATDLRSVLTDYALESWSQKDGLPDASVSVLAQDADGYLWVGTQAGPYRFDGLRFTSWSDLTNTTGNPLPTRALYGAPDGSVWIGFGNPGGVVVYAKGSVRRYGREEGLPVATVTTILGDRHGRRWAGTQAGLFVLGDGRWEPWGPEHGVPTGPITASFTTGSGHIVIAAGRSLLQLEADGQHFAEVAALRDDARAIGEDPLGQLLVSDQEDGFRHALPVPSNLDHLERGRGRALLRDRRNNVWVGTAGQGLWRVKFAPDGRVLFTERATALTGLLADGVVAVMEDREGNIWAGTPEGVNRLTPHKVAQVTNVGLVAGVERASVGALWVGTVDELLELPLSDRVSPRRHMLNGGRLRALHADTDGTLWVATDHGVSRLTSTGLVPIGLRVASRMPLAVESITSDGRKGVWLSDAEQGLLHWQDGVITKVKLPPSLAGARVEATSTDASGRAWFAFSNGLVVTSTGDELHVYGKSDGLDAGVYQAIFEDDDHVIWLGGTQGLTRFDGQFVTVRSDRGFPVSNLTAIVDDDHRTLWVGSGAGILQLRRGEWERLLANDGYVPKFRLYDRSDGLAGLPFVYSRNRRAIRADDGRLWFVTGRGLTILDPAELDTEAAAPPVHIEGILVNGQRTTIAPGPLALSARTNRLELEYSALNLTSPLRQHFRYKLEGFDADWIDAGARRQAFYTNLPPRSYTFRVITSDAEGSWTNAQEAALAFSIRPMFYQTTWFLALSVLAVVAVVGASWRVHVSSVRRQFALLIGERARLSRELHDTLLQNLVGIALQIDAVANDPKVTASDVQRREFVRVRRRVEAYIREARQSISDLRSPRFETHDLATALREAGEREVDGRPIQFTFSQRGTARPIPATLEDQLLKIGREAVVNAARHSEADHISVELDSDDRAVTLRVSDNGTGFDPASVASNGSKHYGLTSMRERAEEMGGRLTVNSTQGRGTRIEATVPLYDGSRGKGHGDRTVH